jgi:hypothetical protein
LVKLSAVKTGVFVKLWLSLRAINRQILAKKKKKKRKKVPYVGFGFKKRDKKGYHAFLSHFGSWGVI